MQRVRSDALVRPLQLFQQRMPERKHLDSSCPRRALTLKQSGPIVRRLNESTMSERSVTSNTAFSSINVAASRSGPRTARTPSRAIAAGLQPIQLCLCLGKLQEDQRIEEIMQIGARRHAAGAGDAGFVRLVRPQILLGQNVMRWPLALRRCAASAAWFNDLRQSPAAATVRPCSAMGESHGADQSMLASSATSIAAFRRLSTGRPFGRQTETRPAESIRISST